MKAESCYEDQYEQSIKCRQLPFNPEQTAKVDNSLLYKRYKQWLKEHGVLIDPRLRYPSYFGESGKGVVGVSVSKAIEKRRAIIAVPYQLLITVDKVKEDLDLFEIVKENVNYFKGDDDAAMRLLVLYISSELIKGEKSIYHPYFSISSEDYLKGWDSKCLQMIENRGLMKAIIQQKDGIELQFMHFLRIYRRYDNLFPQKISNSQYKDIFEKAYVFIMTRAFGWSLPSISLIPMADSLNHSNIRYVNHFVVNTDQEKSKASEDLVSGKGYRQYKREVNLAILKDQQLSLTEEELALLRKEKKSKAQKFVQKHQDILIQSQKLMGKGEALINSKSRVQVRNKQNHILYQQYKAGIHKIANLHFYQSSCEEDNDTDQDELFHKELAREKFSLYDRQRAVTENTKKKQIRKMWRLYQTEESEEEEEQQQSPVPPAKGTTAENKEKLKQQIKQKLMKDNQSSEVSYDDSEDEDDCEWGWLGESNHKKTYFVMSTKNIVRQNEQIYNFYGRRSNKFLLSNYNFVLKDNIYDSYPLSIKLDEKNTTRVPSSKLLLFSKKEENAVRSQELKLKKYMINGELINICRSYVILWTKKEWNNCKLTIPFDRQIQTKTLQLYQDIIKCLLKEYSTSLEEDDELEEGNMKYEERVSIIFRKEYKKILKGQELLAGKGLAFVKKWSAGDIQKFQEGDMKWVRRLKPYLVTLEEAASL